jgi:heme exporter protein C
VPATGTRSRVLSSAALAAGGVALVLGLVVAPEDAVQGSAQRLMYVHVPAAWAAYLCFTAVLVASAGYLLRRDLRWDRYAQAAAELGVGLTALTIALGALWGRPVWGVWWTWDARLVTTAVLLLVYLGYLGIRGLSDDAHVTARRSAAVGIVAFLNVPLVHFSVVWWRTLHQPPTVLGPDPSPPIDPVMAAALAAAVLAFTLGGLVIVRRRVAQLRVAAPAPQREEPGLVLTVTRRGGR